MSRPRFVIVDPSEITHTSHNFAYNQMLIDAAIARGYQAVLLTNTKDTSVHKNAKHAKPFPHTIYDHGEIVIPRKGEPPAALARIYKRSAAVQVMLSDRLKSIKNEQNATTVGALQVVPAAIDLARHLTIAPVVFAARKSLEKTTPFNRDSFAEGLARELKRLKLRKGDKLLVHTASYGLLESFFEVTALLYPNHHADCDAYFIFHMSLEAPDSSTYMDRLYSFSNPNTLKLRMSRGMPFARCHIFATNEPLRQEMLPIFGDGVRLWDHLSGRELFEGRLEQGRPLTKTLESGFRIGVRSWDVTEKNIGEMLELAARLNEEEDVTWVVAARQARALGEHAVRFVAACQRVEIVSTAEYDKFYEFLLGLNALLLPYERPVYERRLSAMYFDALCLGVPCIVPEGTTMAEKPSPHSTLVYLSLPRAANQIKRMRDNLRSQPEIVTEALRDRAREVAAHTFRNPFDTDFADGTEPTIYIQKARGIAVQAIPAWPRCGSTLAFGRQIDELMEAGYFVLQTLIADVPLHAPRNADWVFRLLRENSSISRGHVQRVASIDQRRTAPLSFSESFQRKDLLAQTIERLSHATVRDSNYMRLAKQSQVVMVNHVFNWGWAKQLPGKHLLDTHDIQSHHLAARGARNAVTGQLETFADLFATEAKVWSEADQIFVVSEQENQVIKNYNDHCALLVPYPSARRLPTTDQETYERFVRRNNLDSSFLHIDKFDCMILGDSHPGNIESILWFMKNVFMPHFKGRESTVVIAGRAGSKIYEHEWTRMPFVYFTDFVDDADILRSRSRISVLPDQKGEGISIKFLDALACAHPFVATQVALRGLWFDTSTYSAPATASDFAADIINLLDDPAEMAARRSLAKSMQQMATNPLPFRTTFSAALPAG